MQLVATKDVGCADLGFGESPAWDDTAIRYTIDENR